MKKKIIITTCTLVLAGMVTLAFTWKQLLLELGGYETPRLETAATLNSFAAQHGGAAHFLATASNKDAYNTCKKLSVCLGW